MQRRTFTVLTHVVGWSLFLFVPWLFLNDHHDHEPLHFDRHLFIWRDAVADVLLVSFFYLNTYVLVPRFYFNKRYVIFAAIVLLSYAAVATFPLIFIPDTWHDNSSVHALSHHLLRFLLVFFLSLTLATNNRWKRTEKEKFSAELSSLKLQINPHFLFNTLNSIYTLALKKSDATAEAVVRLSTMMRYVTSEAHNDFVTLDKEIAYVTGFVELQKLRVGNTARIAYNVTGSTTGKIIVPLLLIPFVENAFKYGVSPEEPSFIDINIAVSDGALVMTVRNSKVRLPRNEEMSSGVGLENARQRLGLMYPGRHRLDIHDNHSTFTVNLTIAFT